MAVSSWYYVEDFNYGSEETGNRIEKTSIKHWSKDGKSFNVSLENFSVDANKPAVRTSRVYEIDLSQTVLGKQLAKFHTKAWYTLNSVPET